MSPVSDAAAPLFPAPRAPLGHDVRDALHRARASVVEASATQDPAERYVAAHVGALRAAAAVIAARAQPSRRRPPNAWQQLVRVAPDLSEWAAFFSAGASKRAAAEAGLPNAVTGPEADDLVREVERFLQAVESTLEARHQAA